MTFSLWLPKQTLHEMREIKRCASLAARGKPHAFEPYRHKRNTDPIAHASAESLASLKAVLSDLLISHGYLIRLMLADCGTVCRENLAALPGWEAGRVAAEHDHMIGECERFERAA